MCARERYDYVARSRRVEHTFVRSCRAEVAWRDGKRSVALRMRQQHEN